MEEYEEKVVAVRLSDNTVFDLTINIIEDDSFTMSVSLDNHLFEVQEEDIFPTISKVTRYTTVERYWNEMLWCYEKCTSIGNDEYLQ